jgi:hypothetical protein
MAILTNNLPKAISEVLSGITDGVEDAGSIVANVTARFPEKVVFQIESIVALNSLKREKIVTQEDIVTSTTVDEVLARDDFYLNGAFVETKNYVDSSGTWGRSTVSGGGRITTSYEDNALGVILEIPGPKSS